MIFKEEQVALQASSGMVGVFLEFHREAFEMLQHILLEFGHQGRFSGFVPDLPQVGNEIGLIRLACKQVLVDLSIIIR